MQTALIAGGAGFIGSHLCEQLLSDGYRIICVDNLSTSTEKNIEHLKINPNFTFLKHDVLEPLSGDLSADFVFHLASPASPNHHSPISYHALAMETMLANTNGTLELLKFADKNKARFLFASTSEIYGDPLENPQTEEYRGNTSTTGPRSVYDEAKRFGETLVAYYVREKGLDGRIVRIFNTYGPRILPEDMRMLTEFIVKALKNEPIPVFGDGSQTRSLCFVSDTVDGLCKLMLVDGLKGEIVNIGSSEEHSVLEFAEMVKKLTGTKSEIVFTEPLPQDDPKERRPDLSKAKKLLNWEPKVGLGQGLEQTVNYYKSL